MLHPSVCLTLHFSSFLPVSAPWGTLMIVETWSAPIRQEITPCYIPLMCQLPAEAWLSVCWNTERDGAVGLHPNQPSHSCSFPLYSGHSPPYTASINPCLLMAISLFCTPFTITYTGTSSHQPLHMLSILSGPLNMIQLLSNREKEGGWQWLYKCAIYISAPFINIKDKLGLLLLPMRPGQRWTNHKLII